ncbi:hypothetical protein [Isoptericola sp. NPDC056605]|uniref:hypothetical protein n=1 Tax=Isoptericola sp. NPDC056605 TaxID=3345876 RepID=UPI00369BCAFE
MSQYLPLGTRVTATDTLVRRVGPGVVDGQYQPEAKEWIRHGDQAAWAVPHPVGGVITGVRTLANGHRHWIGYDEGVAFVPSAHLRVYVIAFDLHRRPAYALIDDVRTEVAR